MENLRAVAALAMFAVAGCGYAHGGIDYVAHPELRSVRLYTGAQSETEKSLAIVTAAHEGRDDCAEIAAGALTDLLAQARSVGGDGVRDVRFRGKWHWMGRVVCRQSFGRRSVQVQGIPFSQEQQQ